MNETLDIICINECLPNFKSKYSFVDKMFEFNTKTNPHHRFHYITDESSPIHFAQKHPIEEYSDSQCKEFEKNFINLSPNPASLESVWLKRWIILLNFINKNNINKVLYLDNDVALFTPIEQWPSEILQGHFCLSKGSSPHSNLITQADALEGFVDFFCRLYRDAGKELDGLKLFSVKNPKVGIGDMFLWWKYSSQYAGPKILNISRVFNKSEALDHHLAETENFENDGNYKKLSFQNGIPYCRHTPSGAHIKLHTLHFQGQAKILIDKYLSIYDSP